MKAIIRKILVFVFIGGWTIFRKVLGPGGQGFLKDLLEKIEAQENVFITYHTRPKKAIQVSTVNDSLKKEKKLAVILQGPIIAENNFTLETLKIYQEHFKGHLLVLSTWEGEDEAVLVKAEEMGAHCITSKKPDYFGISNINLQIVSSKAGVKKASELGAEYIFKTRTDQRMYAPNTSEYLYNIIENFPVTGNYPKQKRRIIGVSLNTFKYRMYGLSDMAIYGSTEDMLLYWDIDEDTRVISAQERKDVSNDVPLVMRLRVSEVYLATEFLRKVDREILWTLEDSWQAFADNFCIVDKEQLDLFWFKYNRNEYRWLSYRQVYRAQEMTFREWFNIYFGIKNKNINKDLVSEDIYTI